MSSYKQCHKLDEFTTQCDKPFVKYWLWLRDSWLSCMGTRGRRASQKGHLSLSQSPSVGDEHYYLSLLTLMTTIHVFMAFECGKVLRRRRSKFLYPSTQQVGGPKGNAGLPWSRGCWSSGGAGSQESFLCIAHRSVGRSPLLEMATRAPCCPRGLQRSVQSWEHPGIFSACPPRFRGPTPQRHTEPGAALPPCWFGLSRLSELTSCSDSSGHMVAFSEFIV